MKSIVLLISAAIATTAYASKLVTIPFTGTDRKGLSDSAWGPGRKKLGSIIDVPLENIDLAYLIDLEIGSPPQPFTLLLDTGSSSTWVPIEGCGRFCGFPKNSLRPANSNTFRTDNTTFSIRYGEGFARGYFAQDTMTINGFAVPEVNFAASDYNDGQLTADGADGILGIGPDKLSSYNNPQKKVFPTLVTTMAEKKIIDQNVFSVYFQPVNFSVAQPKRINGEIVFGGVEPRHVAEEVKYVPITTSTDFIDYWAVDIDQIAVGNYTKTYTTKIAALVDTGSTLVFLPRDIINNLFSGVPGLRRDFTGQYLVPCNATNLPDIVITMNKNDYVLKPEHYIIKAGVLAYSPEFCYTYLLESPQFVDAILGYGFLQQYVSVYDNENKQIGFASRA